MRKVIVSIGNIQLCKRDTWLCIHAYV